MEAQREMTLEEVVRNTVSPDHLARRQYHELTTDLKKAIQYLKEGKAKFSPNTTNSFVDDLIRKYDKEAE